MYTYKDRLTLAPLLLSAALFGMSAGLQAAQDRRRCAEDNLSDCINGVSSAVLAPDALRVQGPRSPLATRARAASGREGAGADAVSLSAASGVSGGDAALIAGWTLWSGYARSNFDSDSSAAPYRADLWTFNVGADRLFANRYVLGLTGAYEETDTTTLYNGGGQATHGYSIVPYAVILLGDAASLDVAGGYTGLDTDQNRIGLGVLNDAVRLRASYESERYFGSVNLGLLRDHESWSWSGRLGYLYTEEVQDSYRESGRDLRQARFISERTVSLGQAYGGLEFALQFDSLSPYAGALYRYDTSREDGASSGGLPVNTPSTLTSDRDELELTLGMRYYSAGGVSGSVEWLRTIDRDHFNNQSFQASLRVDF
jgi:outer membrane autotransporter protein